MSLEMASASLALLLITSVVTSSAEPTRWSRQISSYTADLGDWVPLPGPVERLIEREPERLPTKRQAVAEPRILSEPYPPFPSPGFGQDTFPSRSFLQTPANRQLYLQSVPSIPSAPQNFLSDQGFGQTNHFGQGNHGFGQSIRFGLTQPNFALSQGFVAPQLSFDPSLRAPGPQRPPSQNPIKFESFPKAGLPLPQPGKPFNSPPNQNIKSAAPKFVDGYQIENASNSFSFPQNKKKPISLQKLKYDFEKPKVPEPIPVNKQKSEREEVQLLYVPVESLNRGQFNFRSPVNNGQLNGEFYSQQNLPKPQYQQFASDFQRPVTKPVENFSFGSEYYAGLNHLKEPDQIPKFSTISSPFPTLPPTTPRPKKLKPHQPPLAVFLAQDSKKSDKVRVGDVLSSLKNAKTISVLDAVDPSNAPKVFIGPSSLNPPESFVKFELPYLSNIENSDRKLKQLPFFVAPLSYNTPDGFAKIPFPSPHVGSVIVNAQAKDTAFPSTPVADVIPNSYTATPPNYKQEKSPQNPTFSYYSTAAPKTNPPPPSNEFQSNYYSFEPQTVTSIRSNEPEVVTAPPKPGSYYINNNGQYKQQQAPVRGFNQPETSTKGQQYTTSRQRYTARPQFANYETQGNVNTQEPIRGYNSANQATTPRTTIATKQSTAKQTTQTPAPYPKQLLETHNPYSINQAFYQSTPVDYQHFYEEYKEGVSTVSSSSQNPTPNSTPSSSVTPEPTESTKYQSSSSPNYLQNYSPEIHYESEVQGGRFPVHNANDYSTKTEESAEVSSPVNQYISSVQSQEYNRDGETPVPVEDYKASTQESVQNSPKSEPEYQTTRVPNVYNQYSNSEVDYREQEPSTTTSSTTIANNDRIRTSVRTRGRPRYTTTPRTDSGEVNKVTSTRRPVRERRPLPSRSRYEPNKITTERATRKPAEAIEATTKSSRQRVRGRVHYKSSENDEVYDKKKSEKTENDLSYQRDVLHQNYPVTIQERMSTVDIEAMTEPTFKISSTRNIEPVTEVVNYDTEQAFTNEQAYSQQTGNTEVSPEPDVTYSKHTEAQTESAYVPRLPSTRNEEYVYHSRNSAAPAETIPPSAESSASYETDFSKSVTEPVSPVTEQAIYKHYTKTEEFAKPQSQEQEEVTTRSDVEITKLGSSIYSSSSSETVEELPQTTHSYRIRARPGVRQYQQSTSTTEASTTTKTTKYDRKRPSQVVTYRPAFDRRRTTMRIEEIEADLKTKQVHSRQESADHRHPVYKPEPTTESIATTASLETTSKRGQYRRRRPSYTTTTESTATKKSGTYDTKNRFKSRQRTTLKPTTEKSEVQTEAPATTTRPYSRYTRPKLSERYNKKPIEANEESEDQESNYSINRPMYVNPEEKEDDQWAAKYAADSFKPYNPNDIHNEEKYATTERRSPNANDDIITARNDYEEILVSVTPASNKANKIVPDIPPTLEALVEQSKPSTETGDAMSTFETMLDEVMKSLEEQDENEYNSNVLKHRGGEIGEIPPETVITAADDSFSKATTVEHNLTTVEPSVDSSSQQQEDKERKSRRRGFWKKVNVRPATTESIEVAESQYYSSSLNSLGSSGKPSRGQEQPKVSIANFEDTEVDKEMPAIPIEDIKKVSATTPQKQETTTVIAGDVTKFEVKNETSTEYPGFSPGELDLGTGSPDPTMIDLFYTPTTTEAGDIVDRSDGFSLMDYFFGVTASDSEASANSEKYDINGEAQEKDKEETATDSAVEIMKADESQPRLVTTESSFIPEEFTSTNSDDTTESTVGVKVLASSKVEENVTEKSDNVESTSASSFMNPNEVVSTSMSTEVSHETEICFRGKCIKTNKDIS